MENFGDQEVVVAVIEAGGFINGNNQNIFPDKEENDIRYIEINDQTKNIKSAHANQVGEIISGNLGINPKAKLYSIYSDDATLLESHFNEMRWLNINIINNSWSFTNPKNFPNYSKWPKEYDDYIYRRPEIINLFSAWNFYNGETINYRDNNKTIIVPPYKYITGITLSVNSIIVGAYDLDTNEKTIYSQIGNDENYITAVAPGNNYRYTNEDGTIATKTINGTSFATPTISGLLTFVYQANKDMFNLGYDSIIAKSALISGSERLKASDSLYTPETGFGVPNFNLVNEAVGNLWYFNSFKRGKELVQLYLKEGQTLQTNIFWLVKDFYNKVDFSLKVEEPDTLITYSDTNWNVETVQIKAKRDGWYNILLKKRW